ncbi:hypothetical protein [Agathobacter rectalis]|jgi:hypothetical protein|uniref:Uncharacterized protein n=1 Tax=Agathobacter rectalis TaxID=39491 RepID=A0A173Z8T5_9FIRM|nr:hypothetical protein [Agathobacter rectalis]CUN72654.1 Uncharacterised protein [Agathobacter rectalis]
MNSKVAFIIGSVVGVGIGVAGTYSYFKDKYEKLAEEDFNSRRVFDEDKKDEPVEPVVEKTADSRTVDKPSIAAYSAILQKEGYVNYSDMQDKKQKQEIAVDRPYVIQPSDFGEFDDYEKISLTYTADGVLLDDMNEIVDDIEETVGEDSLEHFGEYEDDSVYVRNDAKKCDYEILLDQRNYQEIFETHPHRTEM